MDKMNGGMVGSCNKIKDRIANLIVGLEDVRKTWKDLYYADS